MRHVALQEDKADVHVSSKNWRGDHLKPLEVLHFSLPSLLAPGSQLSMSVRERVISYAVEGQLLLIRRLSQQELFVLLPLLASPGNCPYEVLLTFMRHPEETFFAYFVPLLQQQPSQTFTLDFYTHHKLFPWLQQTYQLLLATSTRGSHAWEMELASLHVIVHKLNKTKLGPLHLEAKAVHKEGYILQRTRRGLWYVER